MCYNSNHGEETAASNQTMTMKNLLNIRFDIALRLGALAALGQLFLVGAGLTAPEASVLASLAVVGAPLLSSRAQGVYLQAVGGRG